MKHTTIKSLTEKAKLALAFEQIDEAAICAEIESAIANMQRIGTPTALTLATHFRNVYTTAKIDTAHGGAALRHSELKRIALAVSLINLGDL